MNADELDALKNELAALRISVNKRFDVLEARLEQHSDHATSSASQQRPKPKQQSDAVNETVNLSIKPEPVTEPQQKATASAPIRKIQIPAFLLQLLPMLIGWLEPILSMYSSYKKRGMGQVFLLTLGGIGLTLVGVGYLIQLMVEQMDAGAKILLFAAVSGLVMLGGVLMHRRTAFKEFAAAIVAMGILIGYSTVYFSGNVYYLLSPLPTLAAYSLIAAICHGIARKLDLKVIYSLGIVGVALLPILSDTQNHDAVWYLIAVCLIGGSSLWFAWRQQLEWLTGLTLASAFIASEWAGLTSISALFIMSCFYLLVLFQLSIGLASSRIKRQAPIIAAYAGSWVALLYLNNGLVADGALAASALSHALLAGFLAFKLRDKDRLIQTVFLLLSALWLCIAAICILGSAHWGLAWLVEGAVLLYLASRLHMPHARLSAQGLIGVAIAYNFIALLPYLPRPALHSVDGWVLAISILFGLSYWVRQISENRLRSVLYLLEASWFCFLLLATFEYWLEQWLTPLVLLTQVALLFWSRRHKQFLIELLAVTLTLIPASIALGAFIDANSLFVGDISWPGRMALFTIFAEMWFWAEFHRRYSRTADDSGITLANISEITRLVFYLILPISWLSSAFHILDEKVIGILWISPLVALTLAAKLSHRLLIVECKILTVFVGTALLYGAMFVDWPYLLGGILGYAAVFVVTWWCKYKLGKEVDAPYLLASIIKFFGVIIPVFSLVQFSSVPIALGTATGFWLACLINPARFAVLRMHNNASLIMSRVVMLVSLLCLPAYPWLMLIPLVFFAVNWFIQQPRLLFSQTLKLHPKMQWHLLLAVTYLLFILSLNNYQSLAILLFGPALVVHGAMIILFDQSHQSVAKLGFAFLLSGIGKILLIDVNATELWQKVLLFIGIGCFLLLASFWYQKLKQKYDHQPGFQPLEE